MIHVYLDAGFLAFCLFLYLLFEAYRFMTIKAKAVMEPAPKNLVDAKKKIQELRRRRKKNIQRPIYDQDYIDGMNWLNDHRSEEREKLLACLKQKAEKQND
jgi:hypothetical protein